MKSRDIMLIHEITPNPNAMRIISNLDIRTGDSVTFKDSNNAPDLVTRLFEIEGIKEIFLYDNFLTITKDEERPWSEIIRRAKHIVESELPFHDPSFEVKIKREKKVFPEEIAAEVEKIERILDLRVRPSLQADGGDLEIESFEGNVLKINYIGACGSCPTATAGTLRGIEGVLKGEYNKDIKVISSNDMDYFS